MLMEGRNMEQLNKLLNELGISKVRLAKYLGVSRQMLYNYLSLNTLSDWPREKAIRLISLLEIKNEADLDKVVVDGDYIIRVEKKLNDGVKDSSTSRDLASDLKGINKKEQDILSDIFYLLKEKLIDDKTDETYNACKYLYHYLQSLDTNKELKFILAYISKSLGFTDPLEFVFDEDKQYLFEGIFFSAFTLYGNGGASKSKIAESHKRFVRDIEHKKEDKLSRTQELNTAKVQALKELGYTEINEQNAKEVLEKIAEIQSRKV